MDSYGLATVWLLFCWMLLMAPAWLIVKKAGYSGAWSLLLLFPGVNLLAVWVFALKRWPCQDRPQTS